MSYTPLTKNGVDTATPLTFNDRQPEKQANISIEVAPDGLHIRCEYTGPLSSIPAAIERLRAAGVLDLVKPAAQSGGNTPPRKPAQRAQPVYLDSGAACCPVHGKELQEGRFGLYCPSRATGDQAANDKGYCSLKFSE